MTKNEEKIIMEALTMILEHVRPDGDLASFSFSERKRIENFKKKLSNGGNADEDNDD